MSRPTRLLLWLLLAALLLGLPHIVRTSEQREIIVFLTINAIIVASYRLLTLTGEWSLAHVVMVGVGAYSSAILSKQAGLPLLLSIPLAALVAAAVAWILSFPLFRMKGFYFLIGSFAAGEAIRLAWRLTSLRDLFGGPMGLRNVPDFGKLTLFGRELDFYESINFYYVSLAVAALSLFVLWRIERSRFGLTFHALHWQDKLAEAVGVDARAYRVVALVVASGFAGLAGGLLAHFVGSVSANAFDVGQMVDVLIWVIVGGTATFYGPLLGLVVLTVLNELVLRSLGVNLGRPLIFGGILILAILFLPKGLESLVQRALSRPVRSDALVKEAS
ncbi:MAG TPA: branched-chain amino acid ABC transporter permease [Kiloniellales bacterium]|nr:branched-chain amino acid ABC transporter permease [Kiloniellales bacterium]